MFKDHQPIIARHVQSSPEAMTDCLSFVFLTIQQSIATVPTAMRELKIMGHHSKHLWGFKVPAWKYARANAGAIYGAAMDLAGLADPDRRERELMAHFASLPGLGLVKAGFMVQLAFGMGGCIDRHNIERFGLMPEGRSELPAFLRATHYKAGTARTRQSYLDKYLRLTHESGGAQQLWDEWCSYVASKFPSQYENANHVSALHVDAMGLEPKTMSEFAS